MSLKRYMTTSKLIINETRDLDKMSDRAGDDIKGRDFMSKRPTLDINIDGVSIKVLNYTKKYVVLLNENSAKVFQKRLRDYCDTDQSICSVPSPTDVGTDISGSDSSSSFGFETSAHNPYGPCNIKN